MLLLSNNSYNVLKSLGYLQSILFRILDSLFVLTKVCIAILKQLLSFHCLNKLTLCLNPLVMFVSIIFRILESLNRIQLHLLMFIMLSIALLRRILCFHCLTKTVICLNP